jgi:type II secretory pathway component PulF
MPTFTYEALNAAGKQQKGTIEASTSEEAIQRIKQPAAVPDHGEAREVVQEGQERRR